MHEVEHEIDAFRRALSQKGLRMTTPRRRIAEKVFQLHVHFTADELQEELEDEHVDVSRATIYRTLHLLEETNLVRSLEVGDGSTRYEHTIGHRPHDHLVCVRCERIAEFRDEELDRRRMEVARSMGFIPVGGGSSQVRGICPSCRETSSGRLQSSEKAKGTRSQIPDGGDQEDDR